jgi:hypothetical protein
LLNEHDIRLMTTKAGDIIVKSIGDHTGHFRAINLCGCSTEISLQCGVFSKKARFLAHNADTFGNCTHPVLRIDSVALLLDDAEPAYPLGLVGILGRTQMQLGVVGFGRMGGNIVRRLTRNLADEIEGLLSVA